MTQAFKDAPELSVYKWLNAREDLSLEALRGRVVAIFAFQMLCPGCVEHSIPQARRVHAAFSGGDLAVIGLHSVFEHHEAMGEESLKAFIHEYKIEFPVAIDEPSGVKSDPLPKTMRTYNLQGTPTLILLDRQGRLRKQKFGHEHDLILGAELMALMREG
jgi:peroxiredoxin